MFIPISIIPEDFKTVDEFFEKLIKNLVGLFMEELDKELASLYMEEGYKVVRTKKRKIKVLFNSCALEIPFSYRVLKSPKTKEEIKPLIEFLKIQRREIYTSLLLFLIFIYNVSYDPFFIKKITTFY